MDKTAVENPRYSVRRANLGLLLKQYQDNATTLAKRLGYAGPSYVSQMRSGHRQIHEDTARKIEQTLGLPIGWTDEDHAEGLEAVPAAPVPIHEGLALAAMRALMSALDDAVVSDAKLEALYQLSYADAVAKGQVDEAYIRRLVDLAI